MSKKAKLWVLVALGGCAVGGLLIYLAGTGNLPFEGSSLRSYEKKFAAKQAQVKRLIESLPPLGSIEESHPKSELSPAPGEENTVFASVDTFLNPERGSDSRILGLRNGAAGDWAAKLFHWQPQEGRITDALAAEFENILNPRYLIAVRFVDWKEPLIEFGQEQKYLPGRGKAEVFLIDLKSDKVLSAFVVSVEQAGTIRYSERDPLSGVKQALRSSLRAGIVSRLNSATGARL